MNPLLQVVLAEANARAQELKEARSGDAHYAPKQPGQLGMMLIMDDANPMIRKIADALGIDAQTHGKIKKVDRGGKNALWAVYHPGDRLVFGEFEEDLKGDDEEDDAK